ESHNTLSNYNYSLAEAGLCVKESVHCCLDIGREDAATWIQVLRKLNDCADRNGIAGWVGVERKNQIARGKSDDITAGIHNSPDARVTIVDRKIEVARESRKSRIKGKVARTLSSIDEHLA